MFSRSTALVLLAFCSRSTSTTSSRSRSTAGVELIRCGEICVHLEVSFENKSYTNNFKNFTFGNNGNLKCLILNYYNYNDFIQIREHCFVEEPPGLPLTVLFITIAYQ